MNLENLVSVGIMVREGKNVEVILVCGILVEGLVIVCKLWFLLLLILIIREIDKMY